MDSDYLASTIRHCGIEFDQQLYTVYNTISHTKGSVLNFITPSANLATMLTNYLRTESKLHSVPRADYELWKHDFIWEALHGQRYAQSFCNQFGISDYVLFFDSDMDRADRYIQENYIEKL